MPIAAAKRVDSPEQIRLPDGAFRIPLKTDRKWQPDRHDMWMEILKFRDQQEKEEQRMEADTLRRKRLRQREVLAMQMAQKQQVAQRRKMSIKQECVAPAVSSVRCCHTTLVQVPVGAPTAYKPVPAPSCGALSLRCCYALQSHPRAGRRARL